MGANGERWASGTLVNVQQTGAAPIRSLLDEPHRPSNLFAWSGCPGDDLFEPSPLAWSQGAWSALERALDELAPALDAAGVRLLIRPHAAHTVADIPACRRILSEERAEHIGLLLEPCAMLAPSMLADAPDHLRRILEALGHRAEGVIVSNVAALPTSDGERLAPAPLHAGLVPPDTLLRLVDEHAPQETMRIWLSGDPAAPRIAHPDHHR